MERAPIRILKGSAQKDKGVVLSQRTALYMPGSNVPRREKEADPEAAEAGPPV
jgi:hypothetical protein